MPTGRNSALVAPAAYGIYPSYRSFMIPPQGMEACLNVRIKNRQVAATGMGWEKFANQALDGTPILLETFFKSDLTQILVAGTKTSLYQYASGSGKWLYLNPRYVTGTVAVTSGNATLVGSGTSWLANTKIGDNIYVGSNSQTDPTATGTAPVGWYTITAVTDNTHINVTPTPSASNASEPYTIIKVFSGTVKQFWSTCIVPSADVVGDGFVIEDTMIFTNQADYPVSWNGVAATVTSRSALAFKCLWVHYYKGTVLYVNCLTDAGLQQPFTFKNSDQLRPFTMAGGVAGEYIVAPETAEILRTEPLYDDMIFYTTREVVSVTFVGAPTFFTFRTAVNNKGLLAGRLLATFGNRHQFVSKDGLYEFNGNYATLVDQHVWRAVLSSIDASRIENSFAFFDEQQGDLQWALTLSTDSQAATTGPPDSSYVAHYLEILPRTLTSTPPTPYTFRDLPFSCFGYYLDQTVLTWADLSLTWPAYNFSWNEPFFSNTFPFVLMGSTDGFIYKLGTTETQAGAALRSFARYPLRPLGDGRHRNLIKRVYPLVASVPSGAYGLTVTTSVYDQEGAVASQSTDTFDLTLTGKNFVSPRRRGLYGQVEFGTAGSTSGQPWVLDGYDMDIVQGGQSGQR